MKLAKRHTIAVLTEWDEFVQYDWQRIYDSMQKPAFVFDGRNILNGPALKKSDLCIKV
jgi:UDPglucose 6-dehydrogenase